MTIKTTKADSDKPASRAKDSAGSKPAADRGAERPSGERADRAEGNRPRAAGVDAIALLRADHKTVLGLFEQFDKMKADGPKKKALVDKICEELTLHTTIEEEIFYPAARQATKDDDLLDEAEVEHAAAKELIAELQGMEPGDDKYDAKVTVLSEQIKHHVNEEQDDLFPEVKKTSLDLKDLGEQMQARKEALKPAA